MFRSTRYIHSDGWRGYSGLFDVGFDKHYRVNHSKNEFVAGSTADKTEIGDIEDMLGSVIEWTSSNYSLYPAHPGKLESPGTDFYIIRGSSFGESQNRLKNAGWLLRFAFHQSKGKL